MPVHAARPELDDPFLILVLGDFSGRAGRGVTEPVGTRIPVPVDCDTVDDAINRIGVKLRIPVDGEDLNLEFHSMDEFHPDFLFENLDIFEDLRDALRSPTAKPRPVRRRAPAPDVFSGSLLDQIVEGTDPLQSFVDQAVSPYLVGKESESDKEWKSRAQSMAAGGLRALLHHPNFQRLEASWRGVEFFVRHVETNSQLKIYLLDVSLDELRADPTGLQKLLAPERKWSLILADFVLNPLIEDVELLARLSLMAANAQAPLLAQAGSHVIGCRSIAETPDMHDWDLDQPAWEELRGFPESSWLGLSMPSFMGRMPYGRNGTSTESFPFEELEPESRHSDYLWCNSAFAAGALIARSFSESGWKMRVGEFRTLSSMPMYVHGGELKSGAEVQLTERAVGRLIDHGLMPLFSRKDNDSLMFGMFQSVNRGDAALQGKWRS
jgi:type VI secretion system protein ImpC